MVHQTTKNEQKLSPSAVSDEQWKRVAEFLKTQLETEHLPKSDATRIVEGLRRQPEETQKKIFGQFEAGNYESLNLVKKLYYETLRATITNAVSEHAKESEKNIAQALSGLTSTIQGAPTEPTAKLPKVQTVAHGECEFQRVVDQYGTLVRSKVNLALDEKGNVTPVSPNAGSEKFCSIYYHQGRYFDRAGQEIRSLDWGNQQLSADRIGAYIEPIKPGVLSVVRDGFLKDLRYRGEQVVFTAGEPPEKIQQEIPKVRPREGFPELTFPKKEEIHNQQTRSMARGSSVTFDVGEGGGYRGIERILRLNDAGDLEMKFRGKKGETVWGSPKDPSSGLDCTCLYVHDGKLFHRDGTEVQRLVWGNSEVSSQLVLSHVEPLASGRLSCLKEGYINRIQVDGKDVVFTPGIPPGLKRSEELSAVRPKPAQEKTQPLNDSLTKLSVSLPHGADNYLGVPLECALDEARHLLVRRESAAKWQRPEEIELSLSDGSKRGVEAVYYDRGRLFRENGEEVKELSLAGRKMGESLFDFGVFRFLDRGSSQPIFGMQPQYVNDITLGDKQVIFVKGSPPAR